MNCVEAESLFDALLDGELTGTLRLEFDAHRLRCRACQQKLSLLEACEHILAGDLDAPAPRFDFTDRVMASIAAVPERRRPIVLRRWAAPMAALPAAAALLVAAGLWMRASSGPSVMPVLHAPAPAPESTLVAGKQFADLYGDLWGPVERMQNATLTMRDDFSWVSRYARNLQDTLSPPAQPANPLQSLLNVLLFGAPDALDAGEFSADEASL